MLFISVNRAPSRAPQRYPVSVPKPIAQSTVSMVMTTMSSMRVKAFVEEVIVRENKSDRNEYSLVSQITEYNW